MTKMMRKGKVTRRAFLRACGAVACALAFCRGLGARAWAGAASVLDGMRERMVAAYREDKASLRRCPQDNGQAARMLSQFAGGPGSDAALPRAAWKDRSAAVEALKNCGAWPGKRYMEFRYKKYPFEE